MKIKVKTNPSLALSKYWTKIYNNDDLNYSQINIPATSNLALSIEALITETTTEYIEDLNKNKVFINNKEEENKKYIIFFLSLQSFFKKNELDLKGSFIVNSNNNFKTSSGLASSSSGFAALTYSCLYSYILSKQNENNKTLTHVNEVYKKILNKSNVSFLSRVGSGSAARSVYGGWTIFEKGKEFSEPLFNYDYWPELSIVIVVISNKEKKVSSRDAMNLAKNSSPFYKSWLIEAEKDYKEILNSVKNKDIEKLGYFMKKNYMHMFFTMFSSYPSVIYWENKTLEVLKLVNELRQNNIEAYETMDAGSQVKILTTEPDKIKNILTDRIEGIDVIISKIANKPTIEIQE